jgi:hypothetical protein
MSDNPKKPADESDERHTLEAQHAMRIRIASIRRAAMSELADSLQQMADGPALRAVLADKRKGRGACDGAASGSAIS